jgi:hypothetical protein
LSQAPYAFFVDTQFSSGFASSNVKLYKNFAIKIRISMYAMLQAVSANTITWAKREWLVNFPAIVRELGWCVVEPSFGKEFFGASEVRFQSIGGQLMDAA